MKAVLIIFFSLFLTCGLTTYSLLGEEGLRNWTNTKGQKIKAVFLGYSEIYPDKICIKTKEGKSFTLSPSIFSLTDQKYLAEWKLAKNGDKVAQYNLGWMYEMNTRAEEAEVKWYRKSAEQGYAKAQFKLGEAYRSDRDYKEAVKWYTKAAEQGDAVAQYNLGVMYGVGQVFKGVPKDYKEAVKWYTKSAEQGLALGVYGLCRHFDVVKEYAWKDASLTLGILESWNNIKELVISPKQTAEAKILSVEIQKRIKPFIKERTQNLIILAEQGDIEAAEDLAYLLGKLGEPIQAYTWYRVSSLVSYRDHVNWDRFKAPLTAYQKAEADKAAEEIYKRIQANRKE